MGFHTYDVDRAPNLEDEGRYRYLSREELLAMLAPEGAGTVADLGSGTGFYTDDVAPFAETVYAVDLQSEMHDFYREKGVPENVELVTANVEDLPFDDDHLDGAFSTMTFHEFSSDDSLTELARVLKSGARLVIADWTADGEGADGPPLDERFDAAQTREQLEGHGFEIERAESRIETFVVVARVP